MNAVYLRLVAYVASPAAVLGVLVIGANMIPPSWDAWVAFDPATNMLKVSLEGIATAIAGGIAASNLIFAKWGTK